ncbi:MAG: hypothetical protein JSC085_000299 [Candidatus Tokpelaia sp. JSC085]|nr:MAG: hypothetical protein JSC085_000299 [Candidatus Tokpelaia sp. JSC085]
MYESLSLELLSARLLNMEFLDAPDFFIKVVRDAMIRIV